MDGYFCAKALAIIEPSYEYLPRTFHYNVFDLNGHRLNDIIIPSVTEDVLDFQVVANSDAIFVIGGRWDCMNMLAPIQCCYKFDLLSMTWHRLADLNTSRQNHGACVVGNHIVVTGGNDLESGMDFEQSTELYDISTDTWTYGSSPPFIDLPKPPMCEWRGDCIFSSSETVHLYNLLNQSWSFLAELQEGRRDHSIVVVNDCLYVIGGIYIYGLTSVELYDEQIRQLVLFCPLPILRHRAAAFCYENNIIFSCGTVLHYDNDAESYGERYEFSCPEVSIINVKRKTNQNVWLQLEDTDILRSSVLINLRNPPSLENLLIGAIRLYLHKLGSTESLRNLPLPDRIKEKLLQYNLLTDLHLD